MSGTGDVVMVGPFPPPFHGVAAINAIVREKLVAARIEPLVFDVAAPSLRRFFWSRLGRLPRVLRALSRLVFVDGMRDRALYMSVAGGLGQFYDLTFSLMARIRHLRLVLHHHSYAYLDRPSWLTSLLLAAAGRDALHVVLSPGMGASLHSGYPRAESILVISNAALILGANPVFVTPKSRLACLGFLGNIATEKGVHDFLDVCAAVQKEGLTVSAKMAGPFQDKNVEQAVRQRLLGLPNVEYIGPQFGADKERFYANIDLLLFPTRYLNEAEPLTIHEAMSAGVPVIAYGRGAIPEMLTPACGLAVPVASDFVGAAMARIESWLAMPDDFREASRAASIRFAELREGSVRSLAMLMEHLLQGEPSANRASSKNGPSSKGLD